MAQLVKCLTLDFSLGHDFRVMRSSSAWVPPWVWSLFGILSLLLPLPFSALSLSLLSKNKKDIYTYIYIINNIYYMLYIKQYICWASTQYMADIIISSTSCRFIFIIINFALETSKLGVIKLWPTRGRAMSSLNAIRSFLMS